MFEVSKLDLEQVCLLCALALFSVGFGLLILLMIPQSYSLLHLGFWHFVVSLILLSASGILMMVRHFYTWFSERDSLEKWFSLYNPASSENSNVKEQTSVRMEKPKLGRRKLKAVGPPTREQLQALKEVLGLKQGSLQFKKRGAGVYRVLYDEGKYRWHHLGSWIQLKEKLETKNSAK